MRKLLAIVNPLLCSRRVSANCTDILRFGFSRMIHNRQKRVQWIARVVWIFVVLLGCEYPIEHNESLAGRRAKEFAEAAFVRQDFESAYRELSDAAKRYVGLDDFKKTIARLHTKGYPQRIELKEFEEVPSERKAIDIYLVGHASGQRYYYRLMLEGNAESDYKVSVMNIEYGPPGGSPLRKKFKVS
jgi:hypothetical protein